MPQIIGTKGEELDLLVRQGGTFGPFRVTLKNPDGTPVLLTDATFRGQVRKSFDSLTVDANFSFVVTDALQGKVQFEIDAVQTAAIMAGIDETVEESQYVYDIEYLNEENRVLPLFFGRVLVFREITK